MKFPRSGFLPQHKLKELAELLPSPVNDDPMNTEDDPEDSLEVGTVIIVCRERELASFPDKFEMQKSILCISNWPGTRLRESIRCEWVLLCAGYPGRPGSRGGEQKEKNVCKSPSYCLHPFQDCWVPFCKLSPYSWYIQLCFLVILLFSLSPTLSLIPTAKYVCWWWW